MKLETFLMLENAGDVELFLLLLKNQSFLDVLSKIHKTRREEALRELLFDQQIKSMNEIKQLKELDR